MKGNKKDKKALVMGGKDFPDSADNDLLEQQPDYYEREKGILLDLSDAIVKVREKDDLIKVFASKLKGLFYFTHAVISLIDKQNKTYYPFLLDIEALHIRHRKELPSLLAKQYFLDDPFIEMVSASETPISFALDDIMDKPRIPGFVKVNYETGIKEAMIARLNNKMETIGFIFIYSDKENSFSDAFKNILHAITPLLSNAVANIIINDEIKNKEKEKSFLLNFSNDIAAVRTKDDLGLAISNVFQNVLHQKSTMIRLIEDDGVHLKPYIYDKNAPYTKEEVYEKLFSTKLTIHEELTERVLLSNNPVVFNIEEEERQGNKGPYIYLWKKAGYKNAYGAPLRVGNTDLGTLWLLTDDVNLNLFKGICAQISIAISNIKANEKVLALKQMLEVENDHLKEQIKTIYNSSDIIGNGPEMQRVYSMMSLVAPSNSTVLLLGETGTGKELVARAIHNSSPRKDKLIIKVNCAALPASLIESELFGHEKGAFTGAIERRIGKFELANNSTLFLDEIGEMPLEIQVKLLRVLQEHELERVGGKATIKVNVRIIAATNRNLEDEVKAGLFRSDLYYRLNVFPIHLPPLRDRVEDIELLTKFFLARYNKNAGRKVTAISANVLKELKTYSWPGNVRELEHLIERSVLLTQENTLKEIQLPVSNGNSNEHSLDISNKSLQEVERAYIIETLRRCNGKIAGAGGAAEMLDIPSTTLHSKLLKLKISKADYFA